LWLSVYFFFNKKTKKVPFFFRTEAFLGGYRAIVLVVKVTFFEGVSLKTLCFCGKKQNFEN